MAPIAHRSVARWRELICLHLARWLPFGGLGSDAFSTPQPFRSGRPRSPRQLAWRAEHSCQSGPPGASPGGTWGSNSVSTDLGLPHQLLKVTNKPVSQVSELPVWSITRYSCCFDPVTKGFSLSVASLLALKCTLSAVRAAQLFGRKSQCCMWQISFSPVLLSTFLYSLIRSRYKIKCYLRQEFLELV